MRVSLIITTYNAPHFLEWCLGSVSWQTFQPCEVIVADDGSSTETQAIINKWRASLTCPLVHSFQPDVGFRLSRSRNLAALKASGDWIVYLDGDCLMPRMFLERLSTLFARGRLIFGSRKLLSMEDTTHILSSFPEDKSVRPLFVGKKFWRVPLGFLRRFPRRSWRNVRGFLMALRREDLYALHGFDEGYRSWGLEDSEFAVRANRAGLTLTDSRYKTSLLHLYHPEPSNNVKSENDEMFLELLKDERRYISPRSCVVDGGLELI
jgi:glycosyltransferase involved in cell wall biosynthesis